MSYKRKILSPGEAKTPHNPEIVVMSSSRFFSSPLASRKFDSASQVLENRAYDIVQRLTVYRTAQPEEIALEVVLSGASSLMNASIEADVLGIINFGFFKTVLGHIGDSVRFEVITYIGKIFEHFWSVSGFLGGTLTIYSILI
jgi:hypothetical protein